MTVLSAFLDKKQENGRRTTKTVDLATLPKAMFINITTTQS